MKKIGKDTKAKIKEGIKDFLGVGGKLPKDYVVIGIGNDVMAVPKNNVDTVFDAVKDMDNVKKTTKSRLRIINNPTDKQLDIALKSKTSGTTNSAIDNALQKSQNARNITVRKEVVEQKRQGDELSGAGKGAVAGIGVASAKKLSDTKKDKLSLAEQRDALISKNKARGEALSDKRTGRDRIAEKIVGTPKKRPSNLNKGGMAKKSRTGHSDYRKGGMVYGKK